MPIKAETMDMTIARIVIWAVRIVVILAIVVEAASVALSLITTISGGTGNLSDFAINATAGALFLLALLDIYLGLGYLPRQGMNSLVFLIEAGLSYSIREIIIQFQFNSSNATTLASYGLIVISLGITLYFASKINRESRQ